MPTIKIEELNIEDAHSLEYSESDDEPIKQAEVDESPILPIPKRQSKNQQECVECPQCNKSLLLKTFESRRSTPVIGVPSDQRTPLLTVYLTLNSVLIHLCVFGV